METLAYTHFSIAQTDDRVSYSQPSADGFVWKLPSLAWMQGLALAIALSSLSLTSSAWAAVVNTNGSPLNVRSGPGVGYRVVSTLTNGTTVGLSGRNSNGWSQLTNGNWVASRWVRGENGGSTVPSSAVLRPGSTGTAVTNLQNRLRDLGVYNGPVTGYYGRLTETAVRTAQASRGLTPDGIAGPRTLTALYGEGGGGGTPVTNTAVVNTNGSPLNVRSGPGLGYRVVDTVADGAAIATTGQTAGNWIQLAKGGWVFSGWVAT